MRKLLAVAVASLAIALPGCSTLDRVLGRDDDRQGEQVQARDVTPERLAQTYVVISQVRQLGTVAFKSGGINVEQAREVLALTDIARAAADKSLELWTSGKKSEAANALEAALAAVQKAREGTKSAVEKGTK